MSLINGAHGIGRIDLTHLGELKPDFMISSCYKFNFSLIFDTTPYDCVPQALASRRDICGDEQKVREYCESIAREGGRRMADMLGTEVLENKFQTLRRCCFTNVRPPLSLSRLGLAESDGAKIERWIKERPH